MVAQAAHVITRLFLRTLFDFIISDLGFGSIHLILLLVHNDLRFAQMQENAGPRMICTFSQQPSMKQNSLSSFLKGKLKVNFSKTRWRPSGSSQLVICSHWRRAESRRHTAKSMLLILTLTKHFRMTAHPMFQLFFSLFLMYSFPIPTVAFSTTSNVSYTTSSLPTYPSCLQPNISWDIQALRFHFQTNSVEFLHQETN